jgi:penicillin-binding protein 2
LTNAGAAVVLDPRTGEVLAFTSRPTFESERFRSRDRPRYLELADWRRAAAVEQPGDPGTLLAGLDVQDGGRAGRARRRRHRPALHRSLRGRRQFLWPLLQVLEEGRPRSVDLKGAIAQSCDVYFYTVANMLGVDRINKWATLLGLGVKSGIDLPNEVTAGAVHQVEAGSAAREVVRG